MRILWYNWRDIKHPEAGGAEVLTHEIMIRLAKMGNEMTLFCPTFPNCLTSEEIDGIKIIRNGGKYTVYSKAKKFYEQNKNDYDIVIDEINARSFLSPDIVKGKPVISLFLQLIHEEWFYETPFPLNYLCYYYLERKWLLPYKDTTTVTISDSSKQDLEKYGFKKVLVIPMGISIKPLEKIEEKATEPTIVFVGRFKKHKLPDHALRAFLLVKEKLPNAKMLFIGDGTMRKTLENMKIKDVVFYGHVDNQVKYELLRKAHVVLMPSVREGWGLVVTESNAMGTPVIAYDAPGLRDSIIDGKTGILLKDNTPEALALAAINLLTDEDLLQKYSTEALAYSKQFNWDNTAKAFDKIVRDVIAAS